VSWKSTAPAGEVFEPANWVKSTEADTDDAEQRATSDTVVVGRLVTGAVVRVAEGDGDEQAPSRSNEPAPRTAVRRAEPGRRARGVLLGVLRGGPCLMLA
jgi:uncharacterized protein (DUF3084 family)